MLKEKIVNIIGITCISLLWILGFWFIYLNYKSYNNEIMILGIFTIIDAGIMTILYRMSR